MNKEITEAICLLDQMWGHHGEGSDLLVTGPSKMFDIIFNEVMPRLRTVNGLGVIFKHPQRPCFKCGLPTQDGGPCPHCDKVRWEMDDIIKRRD